MRISAHGPHRRGSSRAFAISAAAVALGVSVPAAAQLQGTVLETRTKGRNISVTDRDRPEYDSTGIYLGGFILAPSVSVRGGYTDNVYLTDGDKKSDGYVSINPSVRINSTWSRNAVAAELHGGFVRYFNSSIRDEDNYGGSVGGRYELGSTASVNALVKYDRSYESQYNLTTVNGGASVIPVDNLAGTASATTQRGPFRLSAIGNVQRLNYQNYRTLANVTISQDDRDRVSYSGAGQVDYAVSPDTSVFGQLGYERTDYDQVLAPGIQNRNSSSLRAIVGASTDITALIRGRIGLGYIRRNYESARFETVSGFALEAQLEYFPTEITTVTIDLHRVLEDASTTVQGGFFRTGGGARVDHELLRNLLLNASVRYDVADYGNNIGDARVWQTEGGATYLLTRRFSVNAGVSYGKRTQDSGIFGNPFNEFRGFAALRFKL